MNRKKIIIIAVSVVLCIALIVVAINFVPGLVKAHKAMTKYETICDCVASGDYKTATAVLFDDFNRTLIHKKVSPDQVYTTVLQIFELSINNGDFDTAWQIIEWLSDNGALPNIYKKPRHFDNMVNSNLQSYFKDVSFTNEQYYDEYTEFVTAKFIELYNTNDTLNAIYIDNETGVYHQRCEWDFSLVLWMYSLLPEPNENYHCAEAIMVAIIAAAAADTYNFPKDTKKAIMSQPLEALAQYSHCYVYEKMNSETNFYNRVLP